MRLPIGDSHRFGKQVERKQIGIESWFEKPRSVALERLLLFEGPDNATIAQHLWFSRPTEISTSGPWKGHAKEVCAADSHKAQQLHLSNPYHGNLGSLISFATICGLIDLHNENVVACDDPVFGLTPVPIDLEIALWDCVSAIDTHLIPSPVTSKELAGANGGQAQEFVPNHFSELLDAFLRHSAKLIPCAGEVLTLIYERLADQPIRVILRPTRLYRSLLKGGRSDGLKPLLPAEVVQLRANDIPYFFLFRNEGKKLLFFSSENCIEQADPTGFEGVLESSTRTVDYLSDKYRLLNLRKVSALHLCRAFAQSIPVETLTGKEFRWKRSGSTFGLETDSFRAESTFTQNTPIISNGIV